MDNLPIVQKTEHLNIRMVDGDRVMTYQDIADAYQVPAVAIRKAFSRHKESWVERCVEKTHPGEFFTVPVSTTKGNQNVSVFTFRGAMRFAFYIRSRVAEKIQSHLLDLIEAEANGQIKIEQTPPQTNMFDAAMARFADMVGLSMVDINKKVEALTEQVANAGKIDRDVVAHNVLTRIQELDTSKAYLKKVVWAIVARARSADDNDLFSKPFKSYQATWHAVYDAAVPVVSKLEKYTTKAQINTSIDAAERLLVRMGGTLPPRQLEMQEVVVGA